MCTERTLLHRTKPAATDDLAALSMERHAEFNSPSSKLRTASGLKDPRTQPRAQSRSGKPWVTRTTAHNCFRKRPEGAREHVLSFHHTAIHVENGRATSVSFQDEFRRILKRYDVGHNPLSSALGTYSGSPYALRRTHGIRAVRLIRRSIPMPVTEPFVPAPHGSHGQQSADQGCCEDDLKITDHLG